MRKVRLVEKREIGLTLFRWGVYVQVRWGMTWHHVKVGSWIQNTLRADSRRQQQHKREGDPRPPRYVYALRLQVSYWRSWKGGSRRSAIAGVMIYVPSAGPPPHTGALARRAAAA